MLHLLDANVLIRAHEDYYPIDRVPQFWSWITEIGQAGHAKLPFEIYHEISVAKGPLSDWIKGSAVKEALLFDEEADPALLQMVLDEGYGPALTDDELEKVGRDPFLVAYALAASDRCVVTKEVSKPNRQRANRKIPDICNSLSVYWITDFELYRNLGFSTT